MEFAVNYSEAAAGLVREGRIAPDRFKCPDWPDTIAVAQAQRPVYVHFSLKAGGLEPATPDLKHIDGLRRQTDTPHVNTHLDPQLSVQDGLFARGEAAIQRSVEDVRQLVGRYGPEQVVVENVPFWCRERQHTRLAAEPDSIRRVVEETGCGLLLDLSHARIAAREMDLDAQAYVEALPVERLRELHVTGLQRVDGRLRDHLPMTEDDWRFFTWALEQIVAGRWSQPRLVAFEYGGLGPTFAWRSDPEVLRAQVPRFRTLVHEAREVCGAEEAAPTV